MSPAVDPSSIIHHSYKGLSHLNQSADHRGQPDRFPDVLPGSGELICIKRGESGYYPSDWNTKSREQNEELANYNNERLGVSAAQRRAMEVGSMYGWGAPGADPASYEQKQQMGGMSFG